MLENCNEHRWHSYTLRRKERKWLQTFACQCRTVAELCGGGVNPLSTTILCSVRRVTLYPWSDLRAAAACAHGLRKPSLLGKRDGVPSGRFAISVAPERLVWHACAPVPEDLLPPPGAAEPHWEMRSSTVAKKKKSSQPSLILLIFPTFWYLRLAFTILLYFWYQRVLKKFPRFDSHLWKLCWFLICWKTCGWT